MTTPSSTTTSLILGASGNTGKHVVNQLLRADQKVRVVVRNKTSFEAQLPKDIIANEQQKRNLEVIERSFLDMSDKEIEECVKDVTNVASCLGHSMSFSGIYGEPRMLCTMAVKKVCDAAISKKHKINVILMNTVGAANPDLGEVKNMGWGLSAALSLLRNLVPPQWDNESAQAYLRLQVGTKNPFVDWVVVRPDSLTDQDPTKNTEEEKPAPVFAFPSPVSNMLTNPGTISRVSVARFISDLALNVDNCFTKYKFQTPAIYNQLPSGVTAVPPKA